jgi:5-methylcytosine-specific restriction protein A
MNEALARTLKEWRDKVSASNFRAWKEWIGKTPDSKVPDDVRVRVYALWDRTCYLSGIKIRGKDWDLEHVIPLSMGGEHREGNLRPALQAPHKEKSSEEAARRADADRAARFDAGIKSSSRLRGPSFHKAPPQRRASKPLNKPALWRGTWTT